jgi:hypothetical protein
MAEQKKSEEVKKAPEKKADMPDFEDDEDGADAEKPGKDFDEDEEPEIKKPSNLKKKPGKPAPKEEGPKLVKKLKGDGPTLNKVEPRLAFVFDKKGQKIKSSQEAIESAEKDGLELEDGTDFLEYARGRYHSVLDPHSKKTHRLGYVNANGVLFPCGFRFKGGHVAMTTPEYGVVLHTCPKCGQRQAVDEAVQGECQNMKLRDPETDDLGPCGFSAFDELDSYELSE